MKIVWGKWGLVKLSDLLSYMAGMWQNMNIYTCAVWLQISTFPTIPRCILLEIQWDEGLNRLRSGRIIKSRWRTHSLLPCYSKSPGKIFLLSNFISYTYHSPGMHCFEMNFGAMPLRAILNGASSSVLFFSVTSILIHTRCPSSFISQY